MIILDKDISKRSKDENGFLIVKDNPIAKAGVFEYLLSEIDNNINKDLDKIVNVYRPFDDLKKIKDNFANKPIKFNHSWVGDDDKQADGAIGSNISYDDNKLMLIADLIIYNKDLINAIESGEIVELSPGYIGEVKETKGRFEGVNYDFIQNIKSVNHLAVVSKGRSGSDLRIQDDLNKIERKSMKEKSIMNLLKGFQSITLDNEASKIDDNNVEDSEINTEDIDKREIIREIMAISAKNADEFEGGEEEKELTIAKLAEKLAYNPSETSKIDDNNVEDSESVEINNISKDDLTKAVAEVVEEIVEEKINEFEDRMLKKAKKINDSYNRVSKALGYNFDYSDKNENDIYRFGYENLTGKKLMKGLDSKTAFELSLNETKKDIFFLDNETKKDNIFKQALNEMKGN